MSSNGFDGSAHRNPGTSAQQRGVSIDHLLKLLHGEGPHRLAGWLRLEDAWFFRERVNALASWSGGLFLQLQIQRSSKLEGTVLLQLVGRDRNDTLDNGLHVFRLQSSGFGDGTESLRCSSAYQLHQRPRVVACKSAICIHTTTPHNQIAKN